MLRVSMKQYSRRKVQQGNYKRDRCTAELLEEHLREEGNNAKTNPKLRQEQFVYGCKFCLARRERTKALTCTRRGTEFGKSFRQLKRNVR